jgi:Ca2+-binding EF-hand superfamily protein
MSMCTTVPLLLAILLFPAAAPNEKSKEQPKTQRQQAFELLDKNESGQIEVEEFAAGVIGKASENKRTEFKTWDLNGDGSLDFEEFRKRGNQPPKPLDPKNFIRRDTNHDGVLSVKEFTGNRRGGERERGRRTFVRYDADGNGKLSFQELEARGEGVVLDAQRKLKLRDGDGDGKLSRDEFLFDVPLKGSERGGRQFALFDFDADESLSFEEFRLTPVAAPDAETLFAGRDRDDDARLEPNELALFMPPRQAQGARRSFRQFDVDADGFLSLEEYKDREQELKRRRESPDAWTTEQWLTAAVVSADVLVLLYLAFRIGRWRRRRRAAAA